MGSIEVISLPVADVDRAARFYVERAGFTLDVDYAPAASFRVVQLTPPGSGCSIQVGTGLTDATPGSSHGVYLIVDDLPAARARLQQAGVDGNTWVLQERGHRTG
jgi:catechol 2,3-dioxygenase-like lactoylglutathione lyase family enzyme